MIKRISDVFQESDFKIKEVRHYKVGKDKCVVIIEKYLYEVENTVLETVLKEYGIDFPILLHLCKYPLVEIDNRPICQRLLLHQLGRVVGLTRKPVYQTLGINQLRTKLKSLKRKDGQGVKTFQ